MLRLRKALRTHQYVLFIGPSVIAVLSLTAYPALHGVFISFTNLHFAFPDWRVVGFENYLFLIADDDLPEVLLNTLIFVGAVVALQISLGLLIALLLDRVAIGRRMMRTVAILPWIIPAVIVGLMFQQLFNGSRLGIVNTLISGVGFEGRDWLSSPGEAMTVMVLAAVWRGVPLSIILQLGGLQTIDRQLYEAAAIDGAGRWQMLRHVTLPSLKPILMINLILATAGTLNHVDIPLALTAGGPGRATEVLALSIYKQGFEKLDAGYASTIATVVLLLNLGLTIAYLRILRNREHAHR